MRTLIENGNVIAWNGSSHHVIEAGVLVFEGNEIVHVGATYEGEADSVIDATGRLVIPGFVNSHLHLTDTPFTKGHQEDIGSPSGPSNYQNYNALYKMLPGVRKASAPEDQYAGVQISLAELLLTGSTTIVELGYDYEIGGGGDMAITETIADLIGASGIRCYTGPRLPHPLLRRRRQRRCVLRGLSERRAGTLRGLRNLLPGLERPLRRPAADHAGARPDRHLRRPAAERNAALCRRTEDPIQLHAGQSPFEFSRVRETEGQTSVEYMMETGLLGPDFIIGHGQFMSDDGDIASMAQHEIDALRESKTAVCHLPWVKARRGGVIDSIQKYRDLGIRQCLGTDNYPLDMFHEMQTAAIVCKIVEKSSVAATCEDVFHMATVGGADALGRPDLGRLAPGCRADIVFVRIDTPRAAPVYDPFKFLVLAAGSGDVDRVIVDGATVVERGEVLTFDVPEAVRRVNEASKRVWARLDY